MAKSNMGTEKLLQGLVQQNAKPHYQELKQLFTVMKKRAV